MAPIHLVPLRNYLLTSSKSRRYQVKLAHIHTFLSTVTISFTLLSHRCHSCSTFYYQFQFLLFLFLTSEYFSSPSFCFGAGYFQRNISHTFFRSWIFISFESAYSSTCFPQFTYFFFNFAKPDVTDSGFGFSSVIIQEKFCYIYFLASFDIYIYIFM